MGDMKPIVGSLCAAHTSSVYCHAQGDDAPARTELAGAGALVCRRAQRVHFSPGAPTGLLHALIVVAPGRISFEADHPCRVG